MKNLSRLKLNQLEKNELQKKEQALLRGGTNADSSCVCGCSSQSLLDATEHANAGSGSQYSYGGSYSGIHYCGCDASTPMATTRAV